MEICCIPGCYSSRQLFLRNPRWADRIGAGQALRSAGTLESRCGALITCRSDRRVGNKPAQHLFVRYFTLKIKLQISVLLGKVEVSGGAGKAVREHQLSGCCLFVVVSSDSEKEQFVALIHLLLACGCVCPLGIKHLMLFAASLDAFPVNCALKKRVGLSSNSELY